MKRLRVQMTQAFMLVAAVAVGTIVSACTAIALLA